MPLTVAEIRERYKEQSRDWIHERIGDLRELKMQAQATGDKHSADIIGAMVDELKAWLEQPTPETPAADAAPHYEVGDICVDDRGDWHAITNTAESAEIPKAVEGASATDVELAHTSTPPMPAIRPWNKKDLQALKRHDLQVLAKEHRVNGRRRSVVIINELLALAKAQPNA